MTLNIHDFASSLYYVGLLIEKCTLLLYDDADHNYNVYPNVVVVDVCFQYIKYRLSSKLKAATCVWCSLSQ